MRTNIEKSVENWGGWWTPALREECDVLRRSLSLDADPGVAAARCFHFLLAYLRACPGFIPDVSAVLAQELEATKEECHAGGEISRDAGGNRRRPRD